MVGLVGGMFLREYHRLVANVLGDMDADVLKQTRCFLGGATAITLQLGEYRKSIDVDFLIGDEDGYRWLRNEVSDNSFGELFTRAPALAGRGRIKKDRFGIRALLNIGGTPVKFEIIPEGRFGLCGCDVAGIPVPVINRHGLFAAALLANADGWAAAETFSRSVIDLAFMVDEWEEMAASAFDVAHRAYGDSVDISLKRAVERIADQAWLQRCCAVWEIDQERAVQVTKRLAHYLALR
jgi:hypothetical protein